MEKLFVRFRKENSPSYVSSKWRIPLVVEGVGTIMA
jgi:hypothetical protein